MNWTEIIGYGGSLLVAVSLLMSNIWYLRWINLAGALLFTIYGVLTHTIPVAAVNGFIMLINIYYLSVMSLKKEDFEIIPANRESLFVQRFLAYHQEDIRRFFPHANEENMKGARLFFVTRNLLPVGLFAVREPVEGCGEVLLDYVIPSHRDHKQARFLYSHGLETLRAGGYGRLEITSNQDKVIGYVQRMGYAPDPDRPNWFQRGLDS